MIFTKYYIYFKRKFSIMELVQTFMILQQKIDNLYILKYLLFQTQINRVYKLIFDQKMVYFYDNF